MIEVMVGSLVFVRASEYDWSYGLEPEDKVLSG